MRKYLFIMLVFVMGACSSVRQYKNLNNIDLTQTLVLSDYLPIWSSVSKEPISIITGETQISEIVTIINQADFVREKYVTPINVSDPFTYTLVLPLKGSQESIFIYLLVNLEGFFVSDLSQQFIYDNEQITTLYKIDTDKETRLFKLLKIERKN